MNAHSVRGVAKPTRRPKKLGEQGWDSHPGWHQTEKLPVKRNPWHGLTPEEAYRKGRKDAERDALMEKLNALPLKCSDHS